MRFELKAMTELVPSLFLQRCHMAFESKTDLFFVLDLVRERMMLCAKAREGEKKKTRVV